MKIQKYSERFLYLPNRHDGEALFTNFCFVDVSKEVESIINEDEVSYLIDFLENIPKVYAPYRGKFRKFCGINEKQCFLDLQTRTIIKVEELENEDLKFSKVHDCHPVIISKKFTNKQVQMIVEEADFDVLNWL